MRVLVLVLLMLLMPLRAWAGDTMALSMAQQHLPAQEHSQHTDHGAHADVHGGVHGGSHAASHESHPDGLADAGSDCPSHAACDLCNGPALSLPVWQAEAGTVRHPRLSVPDERFASLVLARLHRPPIT